MVRTFAAERQAGVLAILRRDGRVEVTALAVELQVSEDTVRRDLRALAAAGHLHKTHGGAVAIDAGRLSFADRAGVASEAKQAIAATALTLLEPGQVVVLDAGSTTLALARLLADGDRPRPLDVITNSLDIAQVLAGRPGTTLHLTGGEWDPTARYLVGPSTVAGLGLHRADWAFLGACALHHDAGATSVDAQDAAAKRAMISIAHRVAVLADATKLDTTAGHLVCAPEDLHAIVTDAPDAAERWARHPAQVHLATGHPA